MESTSQKNIRPKRSWLSFSLRAMLVIVTLLCAVLGWIGRDIYQARIESDVAAKVEAVWGTVVYDYQLATFEEARQSYPGVYGGPTAPPTSPQPPWLDRQLGFPVQARIVRIEFEHRSRYENYGGMLAPIPVPKDIPAKLVPDLLQLPRLEQITFNFGELNDESFELLSQMPALKELWLSGSIKPANVRALSKARKLESFYLLCLNCDDRLLNELAKLPALKSLDCSGENITGDGIASLGQCTQLESMRLRNISRLTDEDFRPMASLKQLQSLQIDHCRITARSYPTFSQLPKLETLLINTIPTSYPLFNKPSSFQSLAEMQAEYEDPMPRINF
ncbi:leucine-rich repeat domain-containing protein [Blastopirellula marina]|uniref:Leucine Rich repeats (2 copies) n=1 Tax=Blastopirellula marina TaxID=124 RepID=A0A2S8GPK3_9BACT|nr:hypothetical protein [Blastopirellula marina]PQO46281.1 hypothetical protein C5Y93_09855 [Blastopirellula marina]